MQTSNDHFERKEHLRMTIRNLTQSEKYREFNRSTQSKRRSTDGWVNYQKKYMAEYYQNPRNKFCHKIRVGLRHWLSAKRKPKTDFYCTNKRAFIAALNRKAKANGFKRYTDKNSTIDHIISIPHFYDFGVTDRKIICDLQNIDICTRASNSEKRSKVPDHALIIASKLEEKYGISGFVDFLIEKKYHTEVVEVEEKLRKLEALNLELLQMNNWVAIK